MSKSTGQLRIAVQGKVISQMIAYIWRWADDVEHLEKASVAQKLRKYFGRDGEFSSNELLTGTHNRIHNNIIWLFKVDSKLWITDRDKFRKKYKNDLSEAKEAAKILIKVFGKQRIKKEKDFLSPLFNKAEIREDAEGPYYEFFVDVSSFTASLEDPNLENPYIFKYNIAFPPLPVISKATVSHDDLERWIEDKDENHSYPNNIYIPVTTS